MYDEGSDSDEFACDCIAERIRAVLPGTAGRPGLQGIIPYRAVYDTQDEARRRGYWIPGVPVKATIPKVERDTKFGLHLINAYLYTIELEHGPFKWSVVKRNKDFAFLAARLMTHRAAERIRGPVRRAAERIDDTLESMDMSGMLAGIDHRPDCPFRNKYPHTAPVHELQRTTDNLQENPAVSGTGRSEMSSAVEVASDSGFSGAFDISRCPQRNDQFESVSSDLRSGDSGSGRDNNNSKQAKPPLARFDTAFGHKSVDLDDQPAEDIQDKAPSLKQSPLKSHRLHHLMFLPDSVGDPEERRKELEEWLQALLHIPVNRNHHETAEFLEVSRFSFVNELGGKYAEGFVKKRPGGQRVFIGWKQFCVRYFFYWKKRWLIVKDSSVWYMDPHTEQLHFVLLFDRDFDVAAGAKEAEGMSNGLILSNMQHELHLKCATELDAVLWKNTITEACNGVGRIWTEPHRFGSTFPPRKSQSVQWFVDAEDYMRHCANMMELAREEIFITDWWLSPEIYMKRPMSEGNRWRLDQILKRKAEGGVRIYVLLYKEMEMALGLNSVYTKRVLQGLHENIKVLRHPDHYPSTGTFFWAHHEKLVIIDQLIAFVGGVDLCYGRWDSHAHMLTDLGSVRITPGQAFKSEKDYSLIHGMRALAAASATLSPLGLEEEEIIAAKLRSAGIDQTDRAAVSNDFLLGKVDVEECPSVSKGGEYGDVKRSKRIIFKRTKVVADGDEVKTEIVETAKITEGERVSSGIKVSLHVRPTHPNIFTKVKEHRFHREKTVDTSVPPAEMVTIDAQKMNISDALAKYKAFVESGEAAKIKQKAAKKPLSGEQHGLVTKLAHTVRGKKAKTRWKMVKEETSEYAIKWMKLRDEDEKMKTMEMEGRGKLWLGKDYVNFIVKDFVDLEMPFHDFIDRSCTARMPWHDIHAVTYGSAARDLGRHFIQRWNAVKTEKCKDDWDYPYLVPKCYDTIKVPRVLDSISERADVQVVRSVSNWSALIRHTEDSIQQAYLSLIANSIHYVYIENQFFVSLIGSSEVLNEISRVLCDRILRAHRKKEKFRVYLMIPLLPGFEGDVGAPGGSALQVVLNWIYLSLTRGPNSLFENLKKTIPDPYEYIHIGSLRTYDLLCGKLVSELIYIHSKLLIVDDKYVIIGSANINDRSQLGNRDSEVCIVVKDNEFVPSTMDGKPYEAGKFARSIRKAVMGEHLGLLPNQKRSEDQPPPEINLDDPICDSFFYDTWGKIAKSNTEIYEEVFHVYPTNKVSSFQELAVWTAQLAMNEYSPQLAEEQLRKLVGNLVEFPTDFLLKENLAPSIASKEGLVPSSVFT